MNQIKRVTILLLVAVIGITAGFAQSFDVTSPLPADTNFKIGKLENGLTYYIRHATNPAGRAEFFIVHNVGSLQENDNQRGLAHFLEHMAFNGTKNFPKKQLLEYFGSIGVKFGANINAYTSMERTVYNISAVPVQRGVVIDSALLALHDWSHYISCEPAEVEAERGVVREEWRRGDDARTRMMKGITRFEQSGSRFAQRDVIGLPEIINTFTRETLVDYYHKWYRPDLQAVIVVGDIDVADIEKRIIERFSTIPKVENGAVRESYSIPENKKPIVGFHTDPESKALSVRMTIKIPHLSVAKRHTAEALYDELIKNLFLDMFKVRCQVAVEGSDSLTRALIPVFGSISYASGTFTTTSLPVNNKSTLNALKAVFIEVERVKQHGFEQDELDAALIRVKKQWEGFHKRVAKPKNEEYVSAAVEHFTRNNPLLNIDAYFGLSKEILGKITLEDVNSSVSRIITDENRVIIFAIPESDKIYLPTEDDVLSLLDEVKNSSLDKFTPVTDKEISTTKEIIAGKILKTKALTSKDLNITYEKQLDSTTEWLLENGARVIWKESYGGTDKIIRMKAFRNGGYALPHNIGEIKVLEQFLSRLSVNGLNKNERAKWSSKKGVSVSCGISYRSNDFSGTFNNVKEAEDMFRLLYLYFTDVSVDDRELKNFKSQLLKNLSTDKGEANSYKDSVNKLRFAVNPTHFKYDSAYVNSITADMIMQLYSNQFMNPAGYTFVFSGPMEASKGKELTEKYIASIKGSKYKAPKLNYREATVKDGEVELRYKAKNMLSTKAEVTRTYHGKTEYSAENNLMAKFITYILRDRYMKSIREERGGTYHVGVTGDITKYPKTICKFTIEFDTDPALVTDLLEVVQMEIDNLVKSGPTEKEMKEIKLYLSKVYQDQKDDPAWVSIITNAIIGEQDLRLEEKKLLDKMNSADIHKFATTIFNAGNRMTFVFEPQL
ncbi:MAG: hypothetical protein CVU13_04335 [Bacteroidetes bacterium HGW-Bacteroidetes-8]|jgi:zinc protease|nr:MAG: hypothetical protein CVU13_04335 [Bacteroidetes bacterium HGW-Bacteroidetes-8]